MPICALTPIVRIYEDFDKMSAKEVYYNESGDKVIVQLLHNNQSSNSRGNSSSADELNPKDDDDDNGSSNDEASPSVPSGESIKHKRPRRLSDSRRRSSSNLLHKCSKAFAETHLIQQSSSVGGGAGSTIAGATPMPGVGLSISQIGITSTSKSIHPHRRHSGGSSSGSSNNNLNNINNNINKINIDGPKLITTPASAPTTPPLIQNLYIRPKPTYSSRRHFLNPSLNHSSSTAYGNSSLTSSSSTSASTSASDGLRKHILTRRSPSPSHTRLTGYAQYQMSLLEVPLPRDYGDASSDDLSSEWDSDVPTERTKPKPSGWRKLRNIVQWTPFFQTYKKQRYPWVQLAGHQGNFKAGPDQGTVLKKLCPKEEMCFHVLMRDVLRPYVPEYKGQVTSDDGELYLQLQDLLSDFNQPCVMDCKIGVRTYLEEELSKAKEKPKLRKDMYEKMIQIDSAAPTDDEHKAKGVTKPRYMVWRETISSTATLGFRIEGIKKGDGTSSKDFKTTKSRNQIRDAFKDFTDGFPHTITKYTHRLKAIRATLECSDFFSSHEVIGSSLLFVHDQNQASIWLIDFAKTVQLPSNIQIDHNNIWSVGNHEDGYLIGINNLICIFEELAMMAEMEIENDGIILQQQQPLPILSATSVAVTPSITPVEDDVTVADPVANIKPSARLTPEENILPTESSSLISQQLLASLPTSILSQSTPRPPPIVNNTNVDNDDGSKNENKDGGGGGGKNVQNADEQILQQKIYNISLNS